jgi:hypothetical protein
VPVVPFDPRLLSRIISGQDQDSRRHVSRYVTSAIYKYKYSDYSELIVPDFHPATLTFRLMDLPDEVHLVIQSHMTISDLLRARGVCRLWHSLIPGSHIPEARLRLLNLYLHITASPAFHTTRKGTLDRLQPFDREHALRMISKDGHCPEDFRLWILEWPERAVFADIWPGLQRGAQDLCANTAASPVDDILSKSRGTSMLNATGPYILIQLEITTHTDPQDVTEMQVSAPWASVPPSKRAVALLLDDAYVNGWQRSNILMLSAPSSSKELVGRVYQVDGVHARADGVFSESWVDYLTQEFEKEEKWVCSQSGLGLASSA